MTLILASSGLLSTLNANHRLHRVAKQALERAAGPLVLSPFVLAELDYTNYTILMRYGQDEFFALLSEVSRGSYLMEPFSTEAS